MKKLHFSTLSVLILLLISLFGKAQVLTPFTNIYQVTQKGGIVYLANSSIGCNINPAAAGGTCQAGVSEAPPLGSYKDNSYRGAFIDIDNDASTFMSSSDSLNLPSCSNITKALLFWGASGASTSSFTTIKMKVNGGTYQNVTAIASETNNVGFNTYHCYADVTTLVKTGGVKSRITVADIPSNQVNGTNTNIFGSWNLVIVYSNDLLTMRQLTVFKGLANISSSAATSTVNIPFSGFLTPLSGPVSLEVGVYVHDGDRASNGDNLYFNGGTGFQPITDAVNGNLDIMNSTVSYNGVLTPFRKPDMNNTGGLDADIFVPNNTLKNYIGNSVTSATFQMTTLASGGETYLPQMITTAIDVYEPDIRASIQVSDVNGGTVLPGDILEYKVKGLNIGSDPSVNTFITDTLERNITLIPNSIKIIHGPNLGLKTDAAGDDQAEYSVADRVIKVRIGTGANGASGGTVLNSPAGTDSTVFTYSVMVTNNCVKISCDNIVDARAYIWGTGNVSGNTFNNGSNPGIFDINGCPIPGITSTPINAASCTVPTASVNPSAFCSSGSFTLSAVTNTDVTYAWSGPAAFTSTLQNPVVSGATATNAGVYTVSLTAYPNCLQTATTSVSLNNCPVAVPDASNTAINTPVSGNAGTNDTNPGGATFSITTQPVNGTVTINASTGDYTFTPAPTFTGITTATYQSCNGSPVVCSNASLTFTVYPNITAVANSLTTTPTASVTGNLTTNDLGIVAGGVYSVSVTQPSTSTGTLTVNGATGQYTFTPNASFNGTTSTTYTVCNTSINPQQCSTTTINITVGSVPVAVNDATTTLINTAVTASAATNDTGVITGTYAISSQPATTSGTVSINATTGVYTFTPTTGFTGTAQATYQLCNAVSPPCSTANITFTVYPAVTAVANSLTTTPTASVTGNLTGNDIGLVAGGVYTVSVTQPSTSTGTLTVNGTTGQYTFTPNASFTGTTSTTYTICNTSINPQQCSNTTITITVGNAPLAVNDATNTVINTPVSGNVSTNDSGILTGSFTVVNPSANGTMTMNPSTGAYSFTPATGFTGVTTATYQLCNLVSPPCSQASITFTVYPVITAVSNSISTTPSVTTTGSLLTNDIGFTSGVAYSVSVTQPATSTGTITINSTTGQYTFVPNPAFTGSASTTYTVCNTSVNPQQCSSTDVYISVGNTPVAVDDVTTTVINTPVSGNAATNDSGLTTGTLTVINPPANGTMTMNPTTGAFTFTPATGFTGVTTATYQLCNVLSPPCSTATITFTVYPDLAAVANTIVTTPSVTTTGSLLTNDTGITTGANYSVTVTQPSPTTGTIIINPSTGQYTFEPNPAFTGSASTSYTVCNTSVNPEQCSNTTIVITVGNTAIAVNDATTTAINTAVTGSAATNDSGVLSATFTVVNPPANGTLTINPGTGVYSFTPATGFTGTTIATYELCNILSPPCATAHITFTVYPNIVAVPNVISTTPSVTATGTLLSNDPGVTPGATYSVTVTPLPPSTGTLSVDPLTGVYSFTPNNTFTGTATSSYTVCNTSINPQQCSNTTITLNVVPAPLAVNDVTNTTINTPVTGSVSVNDTGVHTGTFTVVTPSSNGTLTLNSTTGAYSFTPATGFTGVTTATYQLCNAIAAPCSTAGITFTVYPNVVANNDNVLVIPSTVATGSLLTNDLGITPNATYSVTVTQPSAGTGTISVNPSTGVYSFTPNATFSGSAIATYTVCNISVQPAACSNATITLLSSAIAVNDGTVTGLNTPVSGDAFPNDINATGGTYSLTGLPASGTMSITPAGVYSFTPATGFSGVATATYQLCGGTPQVCSDAVISVTVFPNITSTPDVVNTTPSVTATGTLTTNDPGTIPTTTLGGTYSVSITPPDPSTGTITVDPATGGYTFIPNPSFTTGVIVTTYTICNTSVNPQQCSNSTITLNVVPPPIAVNDATITITGTPVAGDLSTNDSGILTGTFTMLTPSPDGTLSIDPSTGQYLFIPTIGFTGTTSAVYELCNFASPPCATATIVFTVYPSVMSNTSTAFVNTPVSGNASDSNIPNNGLTYGTPGVNGTSHGTLTLNADGTYTFVPVTGYTGTTEYTVDVCNNTVIPPVCVTDTIVITILPGLVPETLTVTTGSPLAGNVLRNEPITVQFGTVTPTPVSGPEYGTIIITALGDFTYTPEPGYTGYDTVLVTVCINTICSTNTIVITVYPKLVANTSTTPMNTSVEGNASTNNTPNTGLTYGTAAPTNTASAADGTLVISPNGNYTFTPATGFVGTIQYTVSVCNNSVTPPLCLNDTINIVVTPISSPETVSVNIGSNVSGNILTNEPVIVQNGTVSTTPVTGPAHGTFSITPSGDFTYTASNPDYSGHDTVVVTVCVGTICTNNTITIVINPVLTNDTGTVTAGTASGNVLTNDHGTGLVITTTPVTGPTKGAVVINPNGSYVYTPTANLCGIDSFAYQACDISVPPLCKTAWVVITIPCETEVEVFVPQGISPNGDGINDSLIVTGIAKYPNNNISIFNRWGNVVYKGNAAVDKWDGTSNTGTIIGDDKLPVGTYFYILDLKTDGKKNPKGYIYLQR